MIIRVLFLSILLFIGTNGFSQDRIIGGIAIDGDQAPWQLSIKSRSGSHSCGAVLIDKRVALTAGHCVWSSRPGDIRIYGATKTAKLSSLKALPILKEIILHPKFRRETFTAHDLAILIFRSDVTFSKYIQPIDLIQDGLGLTMKDDFPSLTNYFWSTSGWGMTVPPNLIPMPSESLMQTLQRPIATSDGNSLFEADTQAYLLEKYEIGEKTINRIVSHGAMTLLAEGPNQIAGTCSGDSGGPLVLILGDQPILAGISSYTAGGKKQCLGVSVYTNIQAYSDWITEQTRARL